MVPGSLTTPDFENLALNVLFRLLKDPRNRTAFLGSGGPSTSAVALQDPLGKCLCEWPHITSPEVALDTKAGGGVGVWGVGDQGHSRLHRKLSEQPTVH